MANLVSYASYIPYWRLDRSLISGALESSGGTGTRSVASYDEDSTTMGVEAARLALRAAPLGLTTDVVLFSTVVPSYVDKSNAVVAHAALTLPPSTAAYDFGGAPRSAAGVMRVAHASSFSSLAIMSDVRTGLPGSAEESEGGDGACAFAFASEGAPLVEVLGVASSSGEFLDRWRAPGEGWSHLWEERFGEKAYEPLARAALSDALKEAGIAPADVDHLIVNGLHGRAVRSLAAWSGVPKERVADDLGSVIGNLGAAQPGVVLADVLDRAEAGSVIVTVQLADGADAVVYRVTSELPRFRARRDSVCKGTSVAEQIAAGRVGLPYTRYLRWKGELHSEPPRRPDPPAPAAPPSLRREAWKFGFVGSRCLACGMRHLPPSRACLKCRAIDQMTPDRVADVHGTIANYTIDRLAYSPSPPLLVAVVDFDGGGRSSRIELTDVDPDEVAIGRRVAMTFRRLYRANDVGNYFWKGRLVRNSEM